MGENYSKLLRKIFDSNDHLTQVLLLRYSCVSVYPRQID